MKLPDDCHRPWELPRRPWIMFMRWESLLFMHWPLPAQVLRTLIPSSLELDTFDGQAWIGITPFVMSGTRLRLTPPLPWLSRFPELNVRTYVTLEGKPGIWFFSLDAARRLAVWGARLTYRLPYYPASMRAVRERGEMDYISERSSATPPATFRARYRPTGPVYRSKPGELDHWLTERYCLYVTGSGGRLWRGEIHHQPWPLQPAEAEVSVNNMTDPLAVTLPDCPPLLHFSEKLDTFAWWPEAVGQ
jgi:uncharacterized protein